MRRPPPILCFVGWSGCGKTTLLSRLVPELKSRGLRVALVKHSSHVHALHELGSDTDRFTETGADVVGLATPEGVSLTWSGDDAQLTERLRALEVDLVLVEGWKNGPHPKIEVWRKDVGPALCAQGVEVMAVVTDDEVPAPVQRFKNAELPNLAIFVARRLALGRRDLAGSIS